ncbi:hypothetical protein FDG92_gp33 [Arthrobacter phage Jasmine]|uniref:Uncharacterized protein n=1 Tax=Arthrobacter phage Jasmine TaxID=1772302 RepID=A0A0U4KNR9_9CAUD|nr:hypothetical protein FDG92_gp33 [Arthrobacter phage Jasmine]ALY09304.1 hypothetical protein JASMINE_34 [Arthrobacter phage Jasmine]
MLILIIGCIIMYSTFDWLAFLVLRRHKDLLLLAAIQKKRALNAIPIYVVVVGAALLGHMLGWIP